MKFAVEPEALSTAVAWAARTLPSRPTNPVLSGIQITAEDEQLVIESSNGDLFSTQSLPATIHDAGRVLVSGRLFADITRALPAGRTVIVSVSGGTVQLAAGSLKYSLQTIEGEYPPAPEAPQPLGQAAGDLLAEAISQVGFAASRKDVGPSRLQGIHLHFNGSSLTMAATDKYRLAVRRIDWVPNRPDHEQIVLVPAADLIEAARNWGTDPVSLGIEDSGILGVVSGRRELSTRLIDDKFPAFEALFPKSSTTTARVATADLLDAIKRVGLLANYSSSGSITFTFESESLTLEAHGSMDLDRATEVLDAVSEGEPMTIRFKPAYLQEALNALRSKVAVFNFTDPNRAAVIQGADELDGPVHADYRHLLMPLRGGV